MKLKKETIKPTKSDDLKIVRQLSGSVKIPPKQIHKNKKAYSRLKKFK